MIALEDLRFVVALSRTGSLSAAARALDVTPPALSMRLKKLEAVLGVNLVVRSSRGLRFTPEGEQLVLEAQSLLTRVDGLADSLSGGVFAGPLRVVAPFGFGRIHVAPVMAAFIREYPQVRATLHLSEAPWNSNVEADVVIHIGTVRDSRGLLIFLPATRAGYAPVPAIFDDAERRHTLASWRSMPVSPFARTKRT
jgi:DNA-binding transcriptional LysR family regulator